MLLTIIVIAITLTTLAVGYLTWTRRIRSGQRPGRHRHDVVVQGYRQETVPGRHSGQAA